MMTREVRALHLNLSNKILMILLGIIVLCYFSPQSNEFIVNAMEQQTIQSDRTVSGVCNSDSMECKVTEEMTISHEIPCEDKREDCDFHKERHGCDEYPGFMVLNCAKTCDRCHLMDAKVRCTRSFLQMEESPAFQPGEMAQVFENMEENFRDRYRINILSRDPWIVYFDNFISNAEIKELMSAIDTEWVRSTDFGEYQKTGVFEAVLTSNRTSMNAWCSNQCLSSPIAKSLTRRIEEITQIRRNHFENFQILKYEPGEYYRPHNDMRESQLTIPTGPRIFTFIFYLNDVEEGGETAFPSIGVTVKPKKGAALLWHSTAIDDFNKQHPGAFHESKDVIRGRKYAANTWIRLYDFHKPHRWGC